MYMTSHPRFMTSQHSIQYISLLYLIKLNISDNTSPVSLSSYPDYRSNNPHCMYDNTNTICMISYEYIWHHIHSLWYHTTLWYSHTLYSCHHTQDTCHRIHCSWAISYILLIRARLQNVWYQTTICMTSYEFYVISQPLLLTSKDCIHDITSTIFLNPDPLYPTWHTIHLWNHSHCNYDKTPAMFFTWYTVYMRSHLLNEWQHNHCIWHDTQCICVIKPTWKWHHNLCTYETTPTACMTP